MKLFRKLIQILTNYHSKNLNTDKITTNPKIFSKEFKVRTSYNNLLINY